MTADLATLEIALARDPAGSYRVELEFSDPRSAAEILPVAGAAPLDLEELLGLQLRRRGRDRSGAPGPGDHRFGRPRWRFSLDPRPPGRGSPRATRHLLPGRSRWAQTRRRALGPSAGAFSQQFFDQLPDLGFSPDDVLFLEPCRATPSLPCTAISEPGSATVPDVFGIGVAYRTAEGNTKITFDINHIRYSQTLGDFAAGFSLFDLVPPEFGGPLTQSVGERFRIDDVEQFHLGLERIILVEESLFVGSARFGAWYEPYHEPEFVACRNFQGPLCGVVEEDLAALATRPTDDEIHLTAGLGLVIKEDYQIDLAIDWADPVTVFSVSLVTFL